MAGNTSTISMQTFPVELISEVFWHCLYHPYNVRSVRPEAEVPVGYVTRSPSRAPLLLGRVCSSWRTIAIATPELWSKISIGGYTSNITNKYRKDVIATQVWMNRAGMRPLSFHITDIGYPLDEYGLAAIQQILDSVVSQSWRWKTIRATGPLDLMKKLFNPLKEGNIAKLENFCSTSYGFDKVTLGFDSQPFALSSSPRLKPLYVSGAPICVDFGDQVHRIQLIDVYPTLHGTLSFGGVLQCLTQCPSLTKLVLGIRDSAQNVLPHSLPAVIELTNLHTLQLKLDRGIDPYFLFDRLFLPSLTKIDLSVFDCTKTDWPHLTKMLQRSRPPLAVLDVYVPMTEITLLECLSYIPEVTELVLGGIVCSDSTLTSLTIHETEGSSSEIVCPSLSSVAFDDSSHFSPEAMKAMILSRCGDQAPETIPGKALREVNCSYMLKDHILLDPDIARCVKGGLTLAAW